MRKRHWWFVVSLALLSLSGGTAAATGGSKLYGDDGADVNIKTDAFSGNFVGTGALGTARAEPFNSNDSKWIGCWIDATPGAAMLTCEAQSSAGDVRCYTRDATLIAIAGFMSDDSYIEFQTPPVTSPSVGKCVSIKIVNGSQYYPKAP